MYSSLLRRPETSATANDIRFNPINPLLFLRAIKSVCISVICGRILLQRAA